MKSLRYAAAALALAPWAAHADTTPNGFTFVDKSNVAVSSVVTSAAITITGITAPTPISVAGGSYSKTCAGPASYTTAASTVNNNQMICVRHTAAATPSTATNTILTVGGVADTFTSTTVPPDTTPNTFLFLDETGVALNTAITSKPITVTGINTGASISVTGGSYSVGCTGTFTAASGTVNNNQTVCVQHTSSGSAGTAVNTKLTIGGVADNFSSITADASTSKTSMIPYGTGFGVLRLYNPLKPFSVSNPVTAAVQITPSDFDSFESVFAVDISGTVVSNIRAARLLFVKFNKVFSGNLTVGQNNRFVAISSLTDACEVVDNAEDLQLPTRSWVLVARKGADGSCGTNDDVRTAIPVNAALSNGGVTPPGLVSIESIPNASGATVGFLTIEGSPQLTLTHRDANFANPVAIMNLATGEHSSRDVALSTRFFSLKPQGQSAHSLYRYDNTANGATISAALYNFIASDNPDLEDAPYDGSNLYFADGGRVMRTPRSATSSSQTQLVGTVAAGQMIDKIRLTSFASTRLVFSASDAFGNGGVYSLLKTANSGTPLTLQSSGFSTAVARLVVAAQDYAYINLQNFNNGTVSALRIGADGNGAVSAPNAYWPGFGLATGYDTATTAFDTSIPYILKATKNAGNDSFAVVDPGTGASGISLGSINAVTGFDSAFGFGEGRFGGLGANIDRGNDASDVDAYFYDSQTANSLRSIAGVAGLDDYFLE